jgi:hypothetical protein
MTNETLTSAERRPNAEQQPAGADLISALEDLLSRYLVLPNGASLVLSLYAINSYWGYLLDATERKM